MNCGHRFGSPNLGLEHRTGTLIEGLGTNIDHHHCREMMVLQPPTWIFLAKVFFPPLIVSSTFILVRKASFSAKSISRNIFQWLSWASLNRRNKEDGYFLYYLWKIHAFWMWLWDLNHNKKFFLVDINEWQSVSCGGHLFFGTNTDTNPPARNLYSFPTRLLGCGNVASICFKGALWSWSLKLHIYSLKAKPSLGGKELVILSNYTENEIGGAIKCLKWGSEKFHNEIPLFAAHAKNHVSVAFP